jgi:hypothetical protein
LDTPPRSVNAAALTDSPGPHPRKLIAVDLVAFNS